MLLHFTPVEVRELVAALEDAADLLASALDQVLASGAGPDDATVARIRARLAGWEDMRNRLQASSAYEPETLRNAPGRPVVD